MLGWKRALLVLVGLVLTEMLGGNLLQPILMKKDLDVSLTMVTLSMLGWGFLLGPAGVVLSVPLTLALKRFMTVYGPRMGDQIDISDIAPADTKCA